MKSKKLKFAMIKLVKNNLTDEGLSILLGYLANDDTTQVLNLTSNQLSTKCLDLFIEVGNKNSFLKTIYLSHNKIASLAIKQRANEFSNLGLELIVWFFTLFKKSIKWVFDKILNLPYKNIKYNYEFGQPF